MSGAQDGTTGSSRQRKWQRIRTNGIVALTSTAKPVVSLIYDLAEGGVSFLHINEADIIDDEFHMDILIFDILKDYEFYLSQLKGRIKGRRQVPHSNITVPVWRYHVEFFKLDEDKSDLLKAFCNTAGKPCFT